MKPYFILFLIFLVASLLVFQTTLAQDGVVNINAIVPGCGDGIILSPEQCDGVNLDSETCVSKGFSSGSLSCSSSCFFDTSLCNNAPSSGGGSGGSFPQSETKVTFSGWAYPNSKITILKDSQVAVKTIAGADAYFKVSLSGLSTGSYLFGIYAEDTWQNKSPLLNFPIVIIFGSSSLIEDIQIPPTIATDKIAVKKGDGVTFFGQSSPKSEVSLFMNSESIFFGKTIAGSDGVYTYNLNTSLFDKGKYVIKSKSFLKTENKSFFSHALSIAIGERTILVNNNKNINGDLNKDNRVNLIDFAILAYWHKRDNVPIEFDFNGDGKITLVDFAVMAYHWTG